jgi:hypothetical protein
MLSALSTSAFGLKRFAAAAPSGPLVFEEFTYTMGGSNGNQYTLLDSPNPYPVYVTSGYTTAYIDGFDTTSLVNATKTLYFKTKFTSTTADGASLFLFSDASATLDTGAALTMYKDSSAGDQIKFIVGSNGTTHLDATITGQSGSSYFHVFLVFSGNTLLTYIYDDTVTQKYYSSTTITGSTFGNDFTQWRYNTRGVAPNLNARKLYIDSSGQWPGAIDVATMEAAVTANPN